jgi:leucyl-tRNA synthetase
MVVPAHDERDFEFAKKYGLEIKEVIRSQKSKLHTPPPPSRPKGGPLVKSQKLEKAFTEDGILINSGEFSGLTSEKAREKITEWLEKKGLGRKKVQYRLRDWVFSRQHYWGEPIPIIHCKKCGQVPVPEKELPLKLPYIEKYQPTGTGESPLASVLKWVNTKCPKCGGPAKRETDTMPNWAGSNWYFMRYCDPKNDEKLADPKKLKYWLPVDWYNGGMEHTTLHLLYSRFIYKFLYDIGVAPTPEPYKKRTSHGIVLAEDGRKMSKSFGNVVNPDDIVQKYGADTLRVYEMFMGPFDQAIAWSTQGVKGVRRFLERVWKLILECKDQKESSKKVIKEIHKLNKKIEEDLEMTKFNTAVAAFMEFINFAFENKNEIGKDVLERFLILLAPFAPHITEELWHQIGHKDSIHLQPWPKWDPELVKEEMITLVIQVNGKVRDKIEVESDISEEKAKELALSREKIKKWLKGKEIKKVVFVPGKLINIVV